MTDKPKVLPIYVYTKETNDNGPGCRIYKDESIKIKLPINTKTSNGIVYSSECIIDMCDQASKKITNGKLLGELAPRKICDYIDYNNVSHIINNIEYNIDENNNVTDVFADIEITQTPKGDLIKSLLEVMPIESFILSPRGLGIVDKDGKIDSYKLISIDILQAPDNEK